MKPNTTPQTPLPDSPSDARDLNQGRDVLKPAYTPAQVMANLEMIATSSDLNWINDVAGDIAMRGMSDPAATIEALKSALSESAIMLDGFVDWSFNTSKPTPDRDCARRVLKSARAALCARDGKG